MKYLVFLFVALFAVQAFAAPPTEEKSTVDIKEDIKVPNAKEADVPAEHTDGTEKEIENEPADKPEDPIENKPADKPDGTKPSSDDDDTAQIFVLVPDDDDSKKDDSDSIFGSGGFLSHFSKMFEILQAIHSLLSLPDILSSSSPTAPTNTTTPLTGADDENATVMKKPIDLNDKQAGATVEAESATQTEKSAIASTQASAQAVAQNTPTFEVTKNEEPSAVSKVETQIPKPDTSLATLPGSLPSLPGTIPNTLATSVASPSPVPSLPSHPSLPSVPSLPSLPSTASTPGQLPALPSVAAPIPAVGA